MSNSLKWILSVALFAFAVAPAVAQETLVLPRASQKSVVKQMLDNTEIKVSYNAPGLKNRKAYGGIVPFGQVWRAGANENTLVTFSSDVKVEGKDLQAGTYGLYVIPTEGEWTFIFSRKIDAWGSNQYKDADDALRVTVTPSKVAKTEWMQFVFTSKNGNTGRLELIWDETSAGFNIEVSKDALLENINAQLETKTTAAPFFQAANYALANNWELEAGLLWIEQAVAKEKNFRNVSTKAIFQHKSGLKSETDATVKEAIALGTDVELYGFTGRLIQEGNVGAATTVANENAKKNKKSWAATAGSGRVALAKNDKKNANKLFTAALKDAPANQKEALQKLLDQTK